MISFARQISTPENYILRVLLSLALPLLLLISPRASGQQPFSLIHYDETALPQNTIGNIQQDRYGYLWMSTQFGIVRFDGEKFKVFTTENLRGLTSNRIRLCAKGLDQHIYFLDENNVIIKVTSPNEFEVMSLTDAIKTHKPLYNSGGNNDWAVLPLDKNVNYQQLANSLKLHPGKEPMKAYAITIDEGYFFYNDQQEEIRICHYKGKNYVTSILSDSFDLKRSFKLNSQVFCQVSTSSAQLLKGINQWQTIPVTGLPVRFEKTLLEDPLVLFSNETGAFFYSSGKLYQIEFTEGSLVATLIFENLPCTAVADVMRERTTGDFLISTRNNGFYRVKKKQFGVLNLRASDTATPEAEGNMNSNIVYSLALWDPQHIYCTGYITPVTGNGISKYVVPDDKGRVYYFFLQNKADDKVWLNFNEGIQSLDKRTGAYTKVAYVSNPVAAVEFSNGSSILVAARSITKIVNEDVKTLLKTDKLSFTAALKMNEDCILAGTLTGLCFFYPSRGRLDTIHYKETLKIRSIYKDRAGRFWFTTYGQGLFYFSGNTIIPIPLDNAEYLSIGHSISQDSKGNFWVPTNHGLFKLGYASLLAVISGKSNKLLYIYFDKTDGFNTNEFNGGCYPSTAYQKETGTLFLPSMDGIVKFNPDSIHTINSNGSIFFDEIIRNDTGRIHRLTDKMVFPSQTSTLRINFSSPYYGHVENIKFSYSLSNEPDRWIELDGERSIALSNLPGENYTLVIKKEDATNPPILATFRFEIKKKFTETVLFKLLLLTLVIGLVYLYFMARLSYLGRERKRLEKEVTARTADQLNLIDQLQNNISQMTQLQLEKEEMIVHKENVIAILIHDIKSPLYFLNTVAGHLDKGMESNAPVKNKKIASEISASLNRLYIFTQDFAIWLEASRPGYIQHRDTVDLEKVVEEALTIYKEIIEKKEIILVRPAGAAAFAFGDPPMIKSVIRNLVDNAVKNMSGGHLSISFNCVSSGSVCEIIIADEGKGMSNADIIAMNNYFQSPDSIQNFSASGFGHKVIRDFLTKLGGSIVYAHNAPRGVVVRLMLPVVEV